MRPHTSLPLYAAVSVMTLIVASCMKEPSEAGSTAEAREAVRRRSDQLNAAWGSGNVDSFMAFFADDAIFASPESPDVRGKAAIREMLAPMFESVKIEMLQAHIDTIEVFDDVAYEWGMTRERWTQPDHPPVEIDGRYTFRWARASDGTWRISRMTGNEIKRASAVAAK